MGWNNGAYKVVDDMKDFIDRVLIRTSPVNANEVRRGFYSGCLITFGAVNFAWIIGVYLWG